MANIFDYERFVQSLNEAKKEKDTDKSYSYGCAMLYFDFPKMDELHESIDEDDIYDEDGHGLETEPHCTLLYGLHDTEIEDYEKVFEYILKHLDEKDIKIKLYNASLFENEYDVLKFDVKEIMMDEKGKEDYSKDDDTLYKINKDLTDNFPYTTDYPDYHPHATIGYLKKGKGKKYVKEFEDKEYEITPKKIVYSKSDGEKLERTIKKSKKKDKKDKKK
jgi:2'-5' RNA ligase